MVDTTDRRTFLTRAATGLGSIALSSTFGSNRASAATSTSRGGKKLLATTDYCDNIPKSGRLLDRKQFDQLHRYLASIGVTRHQWIVDTVWDLYDGDASGFDILREVVESAHAHGIELYAEIKPFEGGGAGDPFPLSLPFPEGALAIRDMRGIYPMARPFVVRHPHLCLQRRPGTWEARGPVTAIRLVKGDDKPTRIKAEDLTIWTSPTNNRFERYDGPVSFRESVEWRQTYPTSHPCRILHLEGLNLPETDRYILIRCAKTGGEGHFTNERGNLVELAGPDDEGMPHILSPGQVSYESRARYFQGPFYRRIMRYFQLPEVEKELFDPERCRSHYQDYFSFKEHRRNDQLYTLDEVGYVAIACGKPEYMAGNLHPIYPEVRNHWLDLVQYCLDRGADGINIRHCNHVQSPENYEYGFNAPAVEAAGGDTSYPVISRVNGDAYTQFLREARERIKSRDKALTIHLYSQMLAPDDRHRHLSYLPPNFEWQWETWVKEIADDLEFRGVWTLRPENLRRVLDIFSAATRAAGKPLYFQGNMKELTFDGPYEFTGREIDQIKAHPGVDGYVLYETAHITRTNDDGVVEGSADLGELLKKRLFS